MRIRSFITAAAVTLFAATLPRAAQATSLVELSTDQMVDASDLVVRATVAEVWTEQAPDGRIWTRAQLEVSDVLKGDAGVEAVIVDQIGGVWAGRETRTFGAARFSPGEDGIFFLEDLESGHTVTVGMFQGKYNIQLDPYSRTEIVHRVAIGADKPYDPRFIPLPAEPDRVSLESFEEGIRSRVAHGWDGQPIAGTSNERLARINRVASAVEVK